MDQARFQRIETLFHRLLELDDEGRRVGLAREEDPEVRLKVAALLAAEVGSSTRIGQVIGDGAAQHLEALDVSPPASLGPCRILGELGRGGFAIT